MMIEDRRELESPDRPRRQIFCIVHRAPTKPWDRTPIAESGAPGPAPPKGRTRREMEHYVGQSHPWTLPMKSWKGEPS
jgi:hypothetical protein